MRIQSQGGGDESQGLLGLGFSICKEKVFNKMMPEAPSGPRTTNEHFARGTHF